MKVEEIMTRDVKVCSPDTNLAAATEILWRNNCGSVAVSDTDGKLLGVITDRDICIALGTRNWRASDLAVRDVAINPVFSCEPDDDIHEALTTMRKHQVRRVPVVNQDGKLAGIVCLDQLVLHAEKPDGRKHAGISYEDVVNTMKAICEHRAVEVPKAAAMAAGAAVPL